MDDNNVPPFMVLDGGKRGAIVAEKFFFERDCVLTVAGKYSKKYWVNLESEGADAFKLTIAAKDGASVDDGFLRNVMNDLIDFQIRLDLLKKFGGLRQTIVNFAFLPVEPTNV
jgi:His-Xaa-Ser system protein HxsD